MANVNKNKCAGCKSIIVSKEYLQCSVCNSKYDLLCSNVTIGKFKNMKEAHKETWSCPECRSKIAKTNNNDTPVRAARADGDLSPPTDYVTTRLKRTQSTRGNPNFDDSAPSYAIRGQPNQESPSNSNTCSTINQIDDNATLQFSKNSLREIIRQEIAGELKKVVAEEFKNIRDLVASFRTSLEFYNEKYEDMRVSLENTTRKIDALEKEKTSLVSSIHELTKRINIMEQHSRSANIELQNVPENRSENLIKTILQLSKTTKCKMEETDIAHCTRIAKRDAQTSRPRSILVKFNTPRLRDSFLAAAINFNKSNKTNKLNTSHLGIATDNPIPIFVVEHLSPENKALHAAARLRGKQLHYKFVWVRNGRIFMKKDEQSQLIAITSQEVLKSIT